MPLHWTRLEDMPGRCPECTSTLTPPNEADCGRWPENYCMECDRQIAAEDVDHSAKRRELVQAAVALVRDAQAHLRLAGAIHAHAAVKKARASVEGALRHAQGLETHPHRHHVVRVHRRRPSKFLRALHQGFREVIRQHAKTEAQP